MIVGAAMRAGRDREATQATGGALTAHAAVAAGPTATSRSSSCA